MNKMDDVIKKADNDIECIKMQLALIREAIDKIIEHLD